MLGIAFAGHEIGVVAQNGEYDGALEAVAFELDLPAKTIVSVESWGADEILESRGQLLMALR